MKFSKDSVLNDFYYFYSTCYQHLLTDSEENLQNHPYLYNRLTSFLDLKDEVRFFIEIITNLVSKEILSFTTKESKECGVFQVFLIST